MDDNLAVADARRDFGEVLNRAHYKNEIIRISKRERPFAAVVSAVDGSNVARMREVASTLSIEPSHLVDLLKSIDKDELKAMLLGSDE